MMGAKVMSRVVTPEQYRQGWLRFLQPPTSMVLIRKLPDGNYLVKDPTSPTQPNPQEEPK